MLTELVGEGRKILGERLGEDLSSLVWLSNREWLATSQSSEGGSVLFAVWLEQDTGRLTGGRSVASSKGVSRNGRTMSSWRILSN